MSGAVSLIRSSVSRWLAARALAGRATAEILRDVAQARIDMAREWDRTSKRQQDYVGLVI